MEYDSNFEVCEEDEHIVKYFGCSYDLLFIPNTVGYAERSFSKLKLINFIYGQA